MPIFNMHGNPEDVKFNSSHSHTIDELGSECEDEQAKGRIFFLDALWCGPPPGETGERVVLPTLNDLKIIRKFLPYFGKKIPPSRLAVVHGIVNDFTEWSHPSPKEQMLYIFSYLKVLVSNLLFHAFNVKYVGTGKGAVGRGCVQLWRGGVDGAEKKEERGMLGGRGTNGIMIGVGRWRGREMPH